MSSVFDGKMNRREHLPHEANDDQYLVEIHVSEIYHVPVNALCASEAIDGALDTLRNSQDKKIYFRCKTFDEKIVEYPNEG